MKVKKPPNANMGTCPCPCCGRTVAVRQNSAGKLYLLCDFRRDGLGGCGMITPNLNDGQAWIRERWTEGGAIQAEKPAEKPPEKTPEQVNEQAQRDAEAHTGKANQQPKQKGVFAGLLDARIL